MPRLPHRMTPIRMRSLAPTLRRTVLASTPRGATSETAPAAVSEARNSPRDCEGMLIVRLLAELRASRRASAALRNATHLVDDRRCLFRRRHAGRQLHDSNVSEMNLRAL